MTPDPYPHVCPLCSRRVPRVSAHHLTPKSLGGRETLDICLDCHGMIHALFANRELKQGLSTVEELTANPEFSKYLSWIAKRPADRRYRATTAKRNRKKR